MSPKPTPPPEDSSASALAASAAASARTSPTSVTPDCPPPKKKGSGSSAGARAKPNKGWSTSTTGEGSSSRSIAEDMPVTPMMDELTDESSDDSDESDELEDAEGIDREMTVGSGGGELEDVSGKELVYTLEVIQQPQRARACGFGDKDRRPLSPPPIIQLRIFDKAGKSISPHSIDFHRFILMVDLWNGDRTQQRSIVMHPGARQDQYALFTHAASRSASASNSFDMAQSTFSRAPLRPGGPGWHGSEWPGYGPSHGPPQPYPHQAHSSHYPPPVSGWPPPPPPGQGQGDQLAPPAAGHRGTSPYGPPSDEWYDEQRPSSSSSRHAMLSGEQRPPSATQEPRWTSEGGHPSADYGPDRSASYPSSFRPATSDGSWQKEHSFIPARDGRPHTAGYGDWERNYAPEPRPWSASGDSARRSQSLFTHAPAPSPRGAQPSLPLTASPSSTPTPLYAEPYSDRLTSTSHYSRVLVGSMGAVCQRLKGLDGEPGLFFFAHDLGIRTEGTFSLRFTLVDLAPVTASTVVKDQATPILARIFSKSFTVYSAKRFPGVLPTTGLTQCFADQSVRLPTRQKRANNGGGSAKRKK